MIQSQTKLENFQQLKSLLSQEVQLINSSTEYLNKIKHSIQNNNLEELQSLIKHNEIPLKQIESFEQQRLAVAAQYGFETNKIGFSRCIELCDDEQNSLNELLEQLYNSMELLKKATMVNDLLLFKNKSRVQTSLKILTGNTQQNQNQTYTESGSKQVDKLSRPLAIA